MEAAVDSLTENLQCVNEALEGHSISDLKLNMEAELASLPEKSERVTAALEGLSISDLMRNMATTIPSLAENFRSVNEALEKAKKHLLLRVQIFDEKIDEQRELSELIMNQVCDGRAEVEKVNYDLNYLTKTLGEWENKITEFDKKQEEKITELQEKKTLSLMGVDDLVQSSEGKSTKAPELTPFSQEFRNAGTANGLFPSSENLRLQKAKEYLLQSFQNLAGKIDEQRELSKLVTNEVRDVAEIVKDNDELNYLEDRIRKTEYKINELRRKQVCNDDLNFLAESAPKMEGNITELKKKKTQTVTLTGVDDLVQSSEVKSTKAPELQEFKNAGTSLGLLPSSENLCLQEAMERLLQSYQNLAGKIDQQPEFSKLNMNEVRDEGEVVKDNDDVNFLAETVSKVEDIITGLKEKKTPTLMGVDDLVQCSEGMSTKAPEVTQFAQEFENAGTSPVLLPSLADFGLEEDKITEFFKKQKAREAKKHLFQRVQNLGRKMDELEKKQKAKEAKKHLSQSFPNLGLKVDELEFKQEYIVAGKSDSNSFADQ